MDLKKLLPPAKENEKKSLNSEKFLVSVKNVQAKSIIKLSTDQDTKKTKSTSSISEDISSIKNSVLKIETILKKDLIENKKKSLISQRDAENKRRVEKQEKLEKKKIKSEKGMPELPSPKLGILDWIKNFFKNMVLGFFAVRLLEHLPTIISVGKKIVPVVKFFGSMVTGLLEGLVNLIDWGYKAYDKTKEFLKNIGGEDIAKKFDTFSGELNKFINLALVVGMAAVGAATAAQDRSNKLNGSNQRSSTGGGINQTRKGKFGVSNTQVIRGENYRKDRTTGSTRGSGDTLSDTRIKKLEQSGKLTFDGKSATDMAYQQRKGRTDLIKKYADRFGKDAAIKRFGKSTVESLGGKYTRSGASNLARKGAVSILGKGGTKAILKFARPFLKRIPIVGALIDFGLSVAFGEKLGRAAFKSIGAAILGTIGTGFGGPIGAVLGGLAGDWAGGKLYDILFEGKKDQGNKKVQGKARGGTVTGANVGRTHKIKRRAPNIKKIKTPKVKPGSSIGGEKVITKIFPEITGENASNQINPLGVLKSTSERLKSGGSNILTQSMAVGVDLAMGQKPTKSFYTQFGQGFGRFVQNIIDANVDMTQQDIARSIFAMASGGSVPRTAPSRGPNFGESIGALTSTLFAAMVEREANSVAVMLKRESLKNPYIPEGYDQTVPEGDDPGGEGSGTGVWGPLLDLISGKESGGNYEAMYPSTTLKGATKMTIAEVVRRATGAVGKYQQLPQYLLNRARSAGLDPNKDLYSPENQDLIITKVNIKGRGGERWLRGEISDEQFMQGLSQEFASLPNAQGRFHYPGQRSSMTSAKVKAALSQVKTRKKSGAYTAGGGIDIKTGKGYGSGGSKIAGELGRFLKKELRQGPDFQAVTEHPEHGGVRGTHASGSYHYSNRAIDIGAWAHEQGKILRAIQKFNKQRGVSPVELLYAGNEPSGHSDHVHVAYGRGGLVDRPTHALIGETGKPEMVFDPDTTETIEKERPGMLKLLNAAKNKKQVNDVLNSYASYDQNTSTIILIPIETGVNSNTKTVQNQTPFTKTNTKSSLDFNIQSALA